MEIKKSKTNRHFNIMEFEDRYGHKCSIQESSLAEEAAIWFGVDDPQPKVLAREAHTVGVKTEETTGWVEYPIPESVLLHTRMHLTQDQVQKLLPILQRFAKTGQL